MPASAVPENHRTITYAGMPWLNTSRDLQPEDLRNRIVLLDFWTYCCINCIQALPDLAKLENEFKDQLVVIGVHSAKFSNEKDNDNIRASVLRYNITHPVVNDADFRIWNKFGVRAWPTLVLMKPNGEVVTRYVGEGHYESLRSDIAKLVKELPKDADRSPLPIALESTKRPPSDFSFPSKVAYVAATKTLYVADANHHQIVALSWNPAEPKKARELFRVGVKGDAGSKDGGFGVAQFNQPQGIVFRNDRIYVADTGNHMIRKIDLTTKVVTTIAGTGKKGTDLAVKDANPRTTSLASPWDVNFFPNSENLVIAMAGTHQIWKLDVEKNRIGVFAGNGSESIDDGIYPQNSLSQPSGMSPYLKNLYFVDSETSSLRVIDEKGNLSTLVGKGLFDFGLKDGAVDEARMQHPLGVYADVYGVYVADTYNHAIRRYDLTTKKLTTVVGNGTKGDADGRALETRLNEPSGIMKTGEGYLIVDSNNHKLRFYDSKKNTVETLVIEKAKVPRQLIEKLPRTLASVTTFSVQQHTTKLIIDLPRGYKLNDDAPSWLAIFQGSGTNARLVADLERSDLKLANGKVLPSMNPGSPHRIQGTLYFCKEMAASVCEIASIDAKVEVTPTGRSELRIEVPSNAP